MKLLIINNYNITIIQPLYNKISNNIEKKRDREYKQYSAYGEMFYLQLSLLLMFIMVRDKM